MTIICITLGKINNRSVFQCMKRYAEVNNEYMKKFNRTQSLNCLISLYANNLCCLAMPQNSPDKDFTFFKISIHLKENNTSVYQQLPAIKRLSSVRND